LSTEGTTRDEPILINIIALLQDAEGTDYIEEMRIGIQKTIILLEKSKFNQDNEKLEKIREDLIEELGEDGDLDEYPPEDCYKLIGSIAGRLGFYDEKKTRMEK